MRLRTCYIYIYIEWKKDIYTDIDVYILRHKQRRAGQRRSHRVTAGEEKKKQLKKNEIKRSRSTRTRTSRSRKQEQQAGAAKRHQNEPKQSAAMAASRSQSQFGAAFWGLQLRKYCFKDYTVTTATATATARHRARNCNTHTHTPCLASPGRSSAAHSRTERNERRKLLQRNVATAPANGAATFNED